MMEKEKVGNNQACHVTTYNSKVTLSIFPVKEEIFLYFSHFIFLTFKAEKQWPRALMLCLINQEFPVRLRATAPSTPLAVCPFLSRITISYLHSYFP